LVTISSNKLCYSFSYAQSISNSGVKTPARQINRRFAARESPRAPSAGAGKWRGAENFCRARVCAILRGKVGAPAAARTI
jgi:hypothetical protein